MHEVERYHDFSAGHRVYGHESACAHLHGHNYRVHFVCQPDPGCKDIRCTDPWHTEPSFERVGDQLIIAPGACPSCNSMTAQVRGFLKGGGLDKVGRVIDFSVIKSLLCMWLEDNWDHRFLVWEEDPLAFSLRRMDATVVAVPFNPTAEALAQHLVEVIGPQQLKDTGVVLVRCRIEETRKCSATFTRDSFYQDS